MLTKLRREKIEAIANSLPPVEIDGPEEGDVLVVGWGSTYGAISSATAQCRKDGLKVAHVHLRHLNPMPKDLGDVLKRYRKVLVPEINEGQLRFILRSHYLVDAVGYNRVRGLPFTVGELVNAITEVAAQSAGGAA